ncbi:MAG: agmatinase family protein [Aureispira sp.]|nr:agmatinase family protein [Aureispira sp.]
MMLNNFNPSGYALKNGNLIGLPFDASNAKVVLLPVPWEATVSYAAGTAQGPKNILDASYQLDLYDADIPYAWRLGIYMMATSPVIQDMSETARNFAVRHIDNLEQGVKSVPKLIKQVNEYSHKLNNWVYIQSKRILEKGQFLGLVGGEHSCPYGYIKALGEKHAEFGILQIDAHCDLRKAYEGFEHSHASIFYNVLEDIPSVKKLVQVGVRDYCEEEVNYQLQHSDKITLFSDQMIKENIYQNKSFHNICEAIIATLPEQVYISFDIDGLDPKLCPNTGTPVPGGFQLEEVFYLIKLLVNKGKKIIGFDLCEVGSASEWDGNVGARALYKLCNWMGKSQGLV